MSKMTLIKYQVLIKSFLFVDSAGLTIQQHRTHYSLHASVEEVSSLFIINA
jgi:hypothetical protein